jgi:hemin uptake protein HemP
MGNPNDQAAQADSPNPAMPLANGQHESLVPKLPKIIPFSDLCRCGDEVWIEHQGQLYRLRCTKQGKLLLTK